MFSLFPSQNPENKKTENKNRNQTDPKQSFAQQSNMRMNWSLACSSAQGSQVSPL